MKLFITSILILFVFKISAKDFTYKSTGTLERNEVTTFPGGGKFISFKHAGGFETDIGKYGKYQCNGSILYDNKSSLENMYFACKFKDQNGDAFIGMGIDGDGFWKDYIGYKCSYAIEYVEDIVFAPVKCKK